MAGPLNAKVIIARCSKTKKTFGIRIEQRQNDWVRTWAFKIDEKKAKHEGFHAGLVTGTMKATDGYPGCPHCRSNDLFFCLKEAGGCGNIGCYDGPIGQYYTCPWCGFQCKTVESNIVDVSGGNL
ncbi:TerY-C metal binding domain-containing protein [Treponema primitia]|uniref:TerY-C metal binding domain-containing protein n=1 Tax=Treponema primitia TaxID=88058 RepID=UPI0002554E61|nr:TerY-C metal binding domain-containing protein [Treponema primitia]